ncbi:MAG: sodium:solute symporter [Flavobacteriaceae bacterium CG_4_8_14_3_um_filter_34_10]|nr:sodium:solute symporter [Flavobacteriia bacterium]OIP52757.1 MAG: sodium:solute symporter [Flavobacteriaceae bacterium CG2_30_34_30]PIQ17703.1 MAG: sodium:solute symporter [Flavobacteriaceae bacterium CG18_big_fil_WC_8_21_14_2_50_34_36]PIV51210.1 MAG: sodium:solute symporter [Flavobacteriaceae bacterium CG02_land_8_20_14_3_00_34_13]PIX10216.1 MAG: sodium:solute symporter [Flavobacteriaceae bacterium CG_4_8_14_3_um_filter_34_10]PIZ07851.1 MAG: sodium:solute symporter [Flavobacteriaceae bacte
MEFIDWFVLITTLVFIVSYGVWKTRGSKNVEDFLKGGNTSGWWTIGLSVMATQASAITFLSTPGQAFHDGMGFVQFYFGLPIAMVVICLVFIPLYHRLKVYTAYEFLENRFDLKTRSLTAMLFLIQRGLSAGITIFAPAIILSAVLGWNLIFLNIFIGILVIIYTVSGGTNAVSVTQKQQMAVIFAGMFTAFFIIIQYLPENITFSKALDIAGASGKMNILDFSFDFDNQKRYTFWSGIIGGTFLALSYFGTDQSQVQRYLSGKSVKQSQMGLIMNGILKVPMQFFILLVGIMVFVFYQFNPSPLNFNPVATKSVVTSEYGEAYQKLETQQLSNFEEKQQAMYRYVASEKETEKKSMQQTIIRLDKKDRTIRNEAKELIAKSSALVETNDKDYVFIHFILNNLPRGLIGLLLAVILSAAMSSTASELNALGTTTTMDLYKRNLRREENETHYLKTSKWFTLLWGIIAISIACVANLFDNLIQLVNIIGSIFYGNVLGIFLLAFFVRYVKGQAVFIAALITQVIVIYGWYMDWMPYLWLNLFGCALVMAIAILLQTFIKNPLQKTEG